jgi:hypothetical protein
MKSLVTEVKRIIHEEVLLSKHDMICESVNNTLTEYKNTILIRESILTNMFSLFLEPKVQKQAEALKDTPEYKELMHQMAQSTRSLNALTDRLKREIDKYNQNLKDMQKSGVKVKNGMDIKQMAAAVAKWRAEKEREFNKKHKSSMLSLNPDWSNYLK